MGGRGEVKFEREVRGERASERWTQVTKRGAKPPHPRAPRSQVLRALAVYRRLDNQPLFGKTAEIEPRFIVKKKRGCEQSVQTSLS